MFVFILPRAVDQVGQMVTEIPEWTEDVNDWSEDTFGEELISEPSEESAEETGGHIRDFVANYGDDILGAVSGVVGAIFAMFTVMLFAFYLTANGPEVRRAIASRLRPESQRRVLWAWEEAIVKTGGYLYSRMLLAIINGSLIFIVMKIVDVPFALALAVFVGVVAAFIPIIGTYIAGALPIFVALVSVGPRAAIVLLIEVLIYQQLENYWLSPRLSQKTIDLNAGLAYGVAMAGGALGGIVAAFFALPVAAVIQSFMANYAKRYEVVDNGELGSPE